MRLFLAWLPLLLVPESAPAPSVQALVDDWRASPALQGLAVGVSVAWADTGEPLAAYRADELRVPASGAKLLTTAAALLAWPAGHAWQTELRAELDDKGTARQLTLVGRGDPRLVPEDLAALAKDLRARGARRVEGGIQVVPMGFGTSALPPGFELKETDAGYRPYVGAAASAFGAVTVTVRPGAEVGAPLQVAIDPATGYAQTEVRATTLGPGAAATLEVRAIADIEGHMRIEVTGGLPQDSKPSVQRKRVVHPNLFTGWLLRAQLEKQKIRVSGPIRHGTEVPELPIVVVHAGRPLESLVSDINTWSNNFMAEMIFLQLGGPPPYAFDRSARAVTQTLVELGLRPEGLAVTNGSGLYAATRVSSGNLTKLLVKMATHPTRAAAFHESLALGGKTGTLAHRFKAKGLRGRVRAKTGTLDDAWSLSGYLTTRAGRTLAFSILVEGGDASRTRAVEAAIDGLVRGLAAHGAKPAPRSQKR